MAEPITLEELKAHLRLDAGVTAEDGGLTINLLAARRAVETRTRRSIVGDTPTLTGDDLAVAKQAILLLAAFWYGDREGSDKEPPMINWLLDPIAQWDDGGPCV